MENTDVGSYIKWGKKIEIGIPAIDEEHKRLVSLCNELREGIMQSKGAGWSASLIAALHVCTDYVQTQKPNWNQKNDFAKLHYIL